MSSGIPSYQGPILAARPELGQVNHISGLPNWPRNSSDDAAEKATEFTLTEAVAWIATGSPALVSGVRDYEDHLREVGHHDPSQNAWFMIDRDAAHFHSAEDRVEGWVYDAAELLRQACERAAVVVTGVPGAGDAPIRIPPADFRGGIFGPGLGGLLASAGPMALTQLRYHLLRFSAGHVRALKMPTRTTPLTNMPATATGSTSNRGRPTDPKDPARYQAMHLRIVEEAVRQRIDELKVERAPIAREVVREEKELNEIQAGQAAERLRKGYLHWRFLHGFKVA